MSFLDVICCGFGAIVLLLLVTKVAVPGVIEISPKELDGPIAQLEAALFRLRGDQAVLQRQYNAKKDELTTEEARLARLETTLIALRTQFEALKKRESGTGADSGKYALARQTLTDEMRRLQANRRLVKNNLIGGIPVDSEYIIFVIDTSPSMYTNAWPLVTKKLEETLNVYPRVKGIQVMSDEGVFMFPQYANQWIPDNDERRKAIKDRIRSFNPASESNPVPGIEKAISTFYAVDKKISIYVFGDDFTGASQTNVVETVARLNARDKSGARRVRIHCVGFPQNFQGGGSRSAENFANLMRQLAFQNQGTFVGLPSYD